MPYVGVTELPNGVNLNRSIHDVNSRLHRMVRYLRVMKFATKSEICRDVFNRTERDVRIRGWSARWFALCLRKGYISRRRLNGRTVYSVGPNTL